jgi:predicted Rossmann-fold nucleotide-binding protein
MAQELGGLITETILPVDSKGTKGSGLSVITGAGPGVMEASGQFAKERRVHGLAIKVPHEKEPNRFVNPERLATFDSYTHRKLGLIEESRAFIVLPGGFGTMEEFLEVMNLMACGAISKRPIVFLDKDYWRPILSAMESNNSIPHGVKDVLALTDTPQRAINWIKDWFEGHPEAHNFTPYRMLLKSGRNSAIKLRDQDLNSLTDNHSTLKNLEDLREILKDAIAPRLRDILGAEQTAAVTGLLLEQGQPSVYGFLKWFVDRLILECHLKKLQISKFTFLAADPETESSKSLLNDLLNRGADVITVAAGDVAAEYRKQVGIKCRRVVRITKPGQEPVQVPVHYNGNVGLGIFGKPGLDRVVISQDPSSWPVGDAYLNLCWQQTKKVPDTRRIEAQRPAIGEKAGFDEINSSFLTQALSGALINDTDRDLIKWLP